MSIDIIFILIMAVSEKYICLNGKKEEQQGELTRKVESEKKKEV